MPNYRSPEAAAYRRLYKTKAWQQLRQACLVRDDFTCRFCRKTDWNSSRLVADHIVPHRGDEALFFDLNNLQCLCCDCHDGAKQSEERIGYSTQIGEDGWPVDPMHVANGGKPQRRDGLGPISHPSWFRPLYVPLTIVCGPPASGKTTYVRTHAAPTDRVLDLDDIAMTQCGKPLPLLAGDQVLKCMKHRNELLADLMRAKGRTICNHAWLIVSEPQAHKRQWWSDKLKPQSIVVLATPADECIRRASADASAHRNVKVEATIRDWWAKYEPRDGDVVIR